MRLLRLDRAALGYVLSLALGTLPAVVVGLLAKDTVERVFSSPTFAAARAAADGGGAGLHPRGAPGARRASRHLGAAAPGALARALAIGCAQALAILPGVSRSGSTIAASLWTGLEREEAARFSFLLSVPAILGALVLQLLGGAAAEAAGAGAWLPLAGAALVAFAVGLLAIRWTALAVVQAHFWKFSGYCLVVGVTALLVLG